MTSRVFVFANGEISNLASIPSFIESDDTIICADGGANYAYKLDFKPSLIIGDLDSITEETLRWAENLKAKIERFPCDKDETDLELALIAALKLKPDEIVIFGALGRRIDHELGNLMLLGQEKFSGTRLKLVDPPNYITLLSWSDSLEIRDSQGTIFSLLPVSEQVQGVSLCGFKWIVNDMTLTRGSTRTISNEIIENVARISQSAGISLAIHMKK